MRSTTLLFSLSVLTAASTLSAETGVPVDLTTRARGAGHVLVAVVERVRADYQRNEFGDVLIVSHAQVRVREVLKGASVAGDDLTLDVEGGTVDGISLRVSDLQPLEPGDQAVLFIDETRDGRKVPHLRGQGILKVDTNGRVKGSNLTVDDVRRAVASARGQQ
jgi:hypothetical protein